jgi:Zn-finger nucleic acid-binding protein
LCPRCTRLGGHSGIVVDVCREHGTWFDRGELEAALRAETKRDIEDVEDFAWATGNLAQSLLLGGHGPYHRRHRR